MKYLLLSALFAVGAVYGQSLESERFVGADTGLYLREAPSASARPITLLKYGTSISIVMDKAKDRAETIAGWPGFWRKARSGNLSGYAFDAFLLPLPTPPANCNSVATYALEFLKALAPAKRTIFKVVNSQSVATELKDLPENPDVQFYSQDASEFPGGHNLFVYRYYEGGSEYLNLKNVTLTQAYLLLKLCSRNPALDLSFMDFQNRKFSQCSRPVGYSITYSIRANEGRVQIARDAFPADCPK